MAFPPAHPGLLQALSEKGYQEPTPVQTAVLDPEATDRDLLVSAQTGSGKTVAFGLVVAPTLLGEAETMPSRTGTICLVVAPTRELAFQVKAELSWLYAKTGTRVVSCVGGMDMRQEKRALSQGAQIVVGTPGRLCDHLERGNLDLTKVRAVVLDEADEMLDLGFREELEMLLQATPEERRTLMFSATLPKAITTLAKQYQKNALRIASGDDKRPHGDIEYRAMPIVARERDLAVVNLLRFFEAGGALVFCATREGVNHLSANLLERGFAVVSLSGELSQSERTRALQALRDGRAKVCVATDVAARGLDLPDLGLVVHADLPRDKQTLLHRSGRTGRAGKKGVAVAIVAHHDRRLAERLFATGNLNVSWVTPPTSAEIRKRDQARLGEEIAKLAAEPTNEEITASEKLLNDRTPQELATALIRMHGAARPAPEDLTPVSAKPERFKDSRDDRKKPFGSGKLHERSERAAGSGHGKERGSERPRPGQSKHRDRDQNLEWVRFRLGVGRNQNAEPRWLIPLLCKRGDITAHDIGAIRIQPGETHVDIAKGVAERFADETKRTFRKPGTEKGAEDKKSFKDKRDAGPIATRDRALSIELLGSNKRAETRPGRTK